MPKNAKVVSVDWEVGEVALVVEGAALLIELLTTHQLADDHQERVAPRAAAAALNLATVRLRDLQRALRGDLDPAAIITSFNSLPDLPDLRRDGVHVLRPWSDGHAAQAAPKARKPRQTKQSKARKSKASPEVKP